MALSQTDLIIYPEEYLVEEDEMSESDPQFHLILYLAEVLKWYYRYLTWYVTGNLELRHPSIRNSQHKIVPDVLVFKEISLTDKERRKLTSWDVATRGAPTVVFEISSRSTWAGDVQAGLSQKRAIYGRIGVKEYWAYDPNDPAVWQNMGGRRLIGWRYDDAGQAYEIEEDERGWRWSEQLQSWLGADEALLRLYDANGQMRIRAQEAEAIERQARIQAEAAQKLARQQTEAAQKLARQQAKTARLQAEAARLQTEAAQEATRLQAEAAQEVARQQIETERQARLKAEAERQNVEQRLAELERELRRLKGEE